MRFVISGILALLFATQAAFAVSPPPNAATVNFSGVSILQPIGGPNISESGLSNWFSLDCSYQNPTSTRFFACWKNGAKYQVTSGKTAVCSGLSYTNTANNQNFQFVWDTATFHNAAALTAGVYQSGASGNYSYVSAAAFTYTNETNALLKFPATYWVGVQLQNGAANSWFIRLVCKEI